MKTAIAYLRICKLVREKVLHYSLANALPAGGLQVQLRRLLPRAPGRCLSVRHAEQSLLFFLATHDSLSRHILSLAQSATKHPITILIAIFASQAEHSAGISRVGTCRQRITHLQRTVAGEGQAHMLCEPWVEHQHRQQGVRVEERTMLGGSSLGMHGRGIPGR